MNSNHMITRVYCHSVDKCQNRYRQELTEVGF